MSSAIVSKRMGKCTSCWRQGAPATLVSHPPMSRCIDQRACEARRLENATGFHSVTIDATVEVVRRHRVHYFHTVRRYIKVDGVEKLVRVDLELVPDRKHATWYPATQANLLARYWNGVARER